MFAETLHLWRQCYRNRRELARWTESDLRDIGVSWSDIAHELEKPFWRGWRRQPGRSRLRGSLASDSVNALLVGLTR
jgi:uncharacterized protein YjiS (DUF1127 family)